MSSIIWDFLKVSLHTCFIKQTNIWDDPHCIYGNKYIWQYIFIAIATSALSVNVHSNSSFLYLRIGGGGRGGISISPFLFPFNTSLSNEKKLFSDIKQKKKFLSPTLMKTLTANLKINRALEKKWLNRKKCSLFFICEWFDNANGVSAVFAIYSFSCAVRFKLTVLRLQEKENISFSYSSVTKISNCRNEERKSRVCGWFTKMFHNFIFLTVIFSVCFMHQCWIKFRMMQFMVNLSLQIFLTLFFFLFCITHFLKLRGERKGSCSRGSSPSH